MSAAESAGPSDRIAAITDKLAGLKDEMRSAVGQVDDVQAKALLETGAEVLGGLAKAFVDYAAGTERAWKR